MDVPELSRQVARRRKELGLSQGTLAQKAGISKNYVWLIERGDAQNLSVGILHRLASALETTPNELLGESDGNSPKIHPALREFSLKEGLSFEIVDKLARIPKPGLEPDTVTKWRRLYQAVRPYIEQTDLQESPKS